MRSVVVSSPSFVPRLAVVALSVSVLVATGAVVWTNRAPEVSVMVIEEDLSPPSADVRPTMRAPAAPPLRGVTVHAEGSVVIQYGRAVRLSVKGARVHIPADALAPGTQVSLTRAPFDQESAEPLPWRGTVPQTDVFTVTASPPQGAHSVYMVIDVPAEDLRVTRVVRRSGIDSTVKWRLSSPEQVDPDAGSVAFHLPQLRLPFSAFAVSTRSARVTDRGLSEFAHTAGTRVVRARAHEDEPLLLEVPGARLHLPANTMLPGTEIELSSTPLRESDYRRKRSSGERPVTPMVTLRASSQSLSEPVDLDLLPIGSSDNVHVRYKTRAERRGCIVDGPTRWRVNLRNVGRRDGTLVFSHSRLPEAYSYVVYESPHPCGVPGLEADVCHLADMVDSGP